jgi:hypothetical protein
VGVEEDIRVSLVLYNSEALEVSSATVLSFRYKSDSLIYKNHLFKPSLQAN